MTKTLLFDQNYSRKLRPHYEEQGFQVTLLKEVGLYGVFNGTLLAAAEGRWDVLVTMDVNLPFENDMRGRKISVLIAMVHLDKIPFHLPYLPTAYEIIRHMQPGDIEYVGEPGRIAVQKYRWQLLKEQQAQGSARIPPKRVF
ncbi:MAG TPA: hypothetical protein VKZ53_22015 [Candidatus Angelobacter sp.]|nr:hypothetical protein [Candidatus Angelobacter sp.]